MTEFKKGDVVYLAKLDDFDVKRGRKVGLVGVVVDANWGLANELRVQWEGESYDYMMYTDQLTKVPPPSAGVVEELVKLDEAHAQFARNLMLEAGHDQESAYAAALYLQERSE